MKNICLLVISLMSIIMLFATQMDQVSGSRCSEHIPKCHMEIEHHVNGTLSALEEGDTEAAQIQANLVKILLSKHSKGLLPSTANITQNQTDFLFLQHGLTGSVQPVEQDNYTLTLNNVSRTLAFSESPERVVAAMDNMEFMDGWSSGGDSFASDPPNSALVVLHSAAEEDDVAVFEVLDAAYNVDTRTFQYEVRGSNSTSIDMPSQFTEATLMMEFTEAN
jgi:hypothetical protein